MDSAQLTYSARAQRAYGRLRVAFNRRGTDTVLAVLRQEGCFKARHPRPEPGGIPETVLLNTSGGITGGDDLAAVIEAGPGSHFVTTTQAAERYYRASPASPPATIRSNLTIAEGALLEWLPQETILFDRCKLDRTLTVDMAADARFLGVESLIFGRQAMGETVQDISLRDRIVIRHGGKLILHDATRLDGEVATLMGRASTFADARAMATIVAVRPDAGDFVEPLRAALGPGLLPDHSLEAGVSAWNGLVLARLLATDGANLRRAVMTGLDILRGGAALPRVWQL
ncbi:urease accessory protein UreD [Acidisoma silvae]|uniref:Urease accessory protein UreD n=1 Tax=Acidisoma silvae TaxID=2802396 RepID=A0A964DXB9_9PROT|nr:urease accessory protein UreD [Acidisoma silvae]MCB8874125.1 urease accessory protein UreD [Acidisoma silvae]